MESQKRQRKEGICLYRKAKQTKRRKKEDKRRKKLKKVEADGKTKKHEKVETVWKKEIKSVKRGKKPENIQKQPIRIFKWSPRSVQLRNMNTRYFFNHDLFVQLCPNSHHLWLSNKCANLENLIAFNWMWLNNFAWHQNRWKIARLNSVAIGWQ